MGLDSNHYNEEMTRAFPLRMPPHWESWASCLHLSSILFPNLLPFEASEIMAVGVAKCQRLMLIFSDLFAS